MKSQKDKKNSLVLFEEILENDREGISEVIRGTELLVTDVFKIKNLLLKKARGLSGADRSLYYKVATKMTINNYIGYLKMIDTHIKQKKNKTKTKTTNLMEEQKYELAQRYNGEIKIKEKTLPKFIEIKLKNYLYFYGIKPNTLEICLRDRNEYMRDISNFKEIKKCLDQNNIKSSIRFMCESEIIKNMNNDEFEEFKTFLNNY